MATQVQLRRGTAAQNDAFTGAVGEVTVDTDNDTLRVHDGGTAGGYELAKSDSQSHTNIDINSGTIDGVTIGGASAGAITGTTITGTSFVSSGNMSFGDNDKAIFGAGSDLEIYHDGSNSYIKDVGTGNLFVDAQDLRMRGSNGDVYATFIENGAVTLYYDNAAKLATTATGVDVTGTVTADGLTVAQSSGANILLESTTTGATTGDIFGEIEFKTNDSNSAGIKGKIDSYSEGAVGNGALRLFTGDTTGLYQRMNISSGGDISFYEDTGTTPKFFWDASAESLGIGTSSPQTALDLAGEINFSGLTASFPSPSQPRLYRSGSSAGAYPFDTFGHLVIQARGDGSNRDIVFATGTAGANKTVITSTGNVGIGTTTVSDPLHIAATDPAIRFEDTSSGITGYSRIFTDNNNAMTFDIDAGNNRGLSAAIFKVDGSEAMRIDSSGFVGIGTSSPSHQLTISGTSTGFVNGGASFSVGSTSNHALAFYTNNQFRMLIDTSGNVGIGTSSPSSPLQIQSSNNQIRLVDSQNTSMYCVIETISDAGLSFNADVGNAVASSRIQFNVDNSEKMRIDSSGNVGIGTSSPAERLHVYDSGSSIVRIQTGGASSRTQIYGFDNSGNQNYALGSNNNTDAEFWNYKNGYLRFATNSTERMRLDASGDFMIGVSTAGAASGFTFYPTGSGGSPYAIWNKTTTSSTRAIAFQVSGVTKGSIDYTSTSTTYNTTSDYRLKEDVQPMVGASDRVLALKPVNFAWKADGSRVDGFLAHEAQEVVPEAVTGEKDAVDADGNPEYQGIDQSKLVPLLTAALQEALIEIENLKARVATLEGA